MELESQSTYSDDLVFGAGGQLIAPGAEADASDVQVAVLWQAGVLQMSNRVSCLDVENLCRAVAACGYPPAVQAEAHAAHDALMRQIVDQVDIENAPRAWIEDGKPVASFLLEGLGQLLNVQVGQDVALAQRHMGRGHDGILLMVGRRCWTRHLR